jgi:hypothetical protein
MHGTGQGNTTVPRPRHQRRNSGGRRYQRNRNLVYPGVQAAWVLGLTDLFEIAANIARDQQRDSRFPLRVKHWVTTTSQPRGIRGMSAKRNTLNHLLHMVAKATM